MKVSNFNYMFTFDHIMSSVRPLSYLPPVRFSPLQPRRSNPSRVVSRSSVHTPFTPQGSVPVLHDPSHNPGPTPRTAPRSTSSSTKRRLRPSVPNWTPPSLGVYSYPPTSPGPKWKVAEKVALRKEKRLDSSLSAAGNYEGRGARVARPLPSLLILVVSVVPVVRLRGDSVRRELEDDSPMAPSRLDLRV